MIYKFFIELVVFILGQLFSILGSVLPGDLNIYEMLGNCLDTILGASTQVYNFFYFIFGDFLYPIFVILPVFIMFKYLTVPLVSFVRKLFIWGGN